MEAVKLARVQYVEYACDQCGKGTMVHTGAAHATCPPEYEHRCTHCGHIQFFSKSYPAYEFVHDGDSDEEEIYTEGATTSD